MTRGAGGLRAWVLQRISALYLGLFVLYLLAHLLWDRPGDFEHWRDWVADPAVGIALMLFFVALLVHAWVGVRDLLMDYVRATAARVGLLTLLGIGLVACGLWALEVLLMARMG